MSYQALKLDRPCLTPHTTREIVFDGPVHSLIQQVPSVSFISLHYIQQANRALEAAIKEHPLAPIPVRDALKSRKGAFQALRRLNAIIAWARFKEDAHLETLLTVGLKRRAGRKRPNLYSNIATVWNSERQKQRLTNFNS